jgi:hypothetical protein
MTSLDRWEAELDEEPDALDELDEMCRDELERELHLIAREPAEQNAA